MPVRRGGRSVLLVVTACVGSLALLLSGTGAGASAASPGVSPASGGGGVPVVPGFTSFDPAVVGYERSEVFISGTANAYAITAPAANDGKYTAVVTSTAPYTTRAVVMRPIHRRRFNGTVVVEWLNVSGGADAGPDWMLGHNELVREGFVWVGVSAQKVGVDALKSPDPTRGDPVRYANLSHPGDNYADDIYSQAGQAIRDDARVILGGLTPKHVIAVGESQSAVRLVTYIDAVHSLVHVYDGFLVHSRFGGPPIRDDLGVPVLVFQTETDVLLTSGAARQPDTNMYRLWEVAGTAHFDFYGLSIGRTDTGDGQGAVAVLESMQNPDDHAARRLHLRCPDQHRACALRPRRCLPRAQAVGRQGHRAAAGTSPPDHRDGFRDGCQRQRARRYPHPGRECTPCQAERSCGRRLVVLLPVRDYDVIPTLATEGALPRPRCLRVRLDQGDEGGPQGRLPGRRGCKRADHCRDAIQHRQVGYEAV